jgi:hypothetical protein
MDNGDSNNDENEQMIFQVKYLLTSMDLFDYHQLNEYQFVVHQVLVEDNLD